MSRMLEQRFSILAIVLIPFLGLAGWPVLVAGVAAAFGLVSQRRRRDRAGNSGQVKIAALIDAHQMSLVRTRARLVKCDAFGQALPEAWNREIGHFTDTVINPALTKREYAAAGGDLPARIKAQVEAAIRTRAPFQEFSETMTQHDLEQYCAAELRDAGWTVAVAEGELLAEQRGSRVVLLCKLYYTRPVGPVSVREARDARARHAADFGIVVSNNEFTGAAERLAADEYVCLAHYLDLRDLESLLIADAREERLVLAA